MSVNIRRGDDYNGEEIGIVIKMRNDEKDEKEHEKGNIESRQEQETILIGKKTEVMIKMRNNKKEHEKGIIERKNKYKRGRF